MLRRLWRRWRRRREVSEWAESSAVPCPWCGYDNDFTGHVPEAVWSADRFADEDAIGWASISPAYQSMGHPPIDGDVYECDACCSLMVVEHLRPATLMRVRRAGKGAKNPDQPHRTGDFDPVKDLQRRLIAVEAERDRLLGEVEYYRERWKVAIAASGRVLDKIGAMKCTACESRLTWASPCRVCGGVGRVPRA